MRGLGLAELVDPVAKAATGLFKADCQIIGVLPVDLFPPSRHPYPRKQSRVYRSLRRWGLEGKSQETGCREVIVERQDAIQTELVHKDEAGTIS